MRTYGRRSTGPLQQNNSSDGKLNFLKIWDVIPERLTTLICLFSIKFATGAWNVRHGRNIRRMAQKADFDYGSGFRQWYERLKRFHWSGQESSLVFLYSIGMKPKRVMLPKNMPWEDHTRLIPGDSNSEDMDCIWRERMGAKKENFSETYKPGNRAFIGTEKPSYMASVRGYYRTPDVVYIAEFQ